MKTPLDNSVSSPLVQSLATTLNDRIQSGRYRDKQGFPSERELVEEFGVSRTLIRRVLETLEADGTILRSPRCRTVVRSFADTGRIPRKTKRRNVGLGMWPNPTHLSTSFVVQGICRTLDQSAYRLVIGNIVWDSWESVTQSEARFLESMAGDTDVTGVLLWYLGGPANIGVLRKLRAANIPIVFMDRLPPSGFEGDFVGVDNQHGAETIVRHLISRGHRHIAHITNGDNASTVKQRLMGYTQALAQANIPFRPELIVTATEGSNVEAPRTHGAMLDHLLSLRNPPTAAFAVNDVTADRFMTALRGRGLRIPDDMAVAGFDGLERWSSAEPFLTTVQQPFEQIGINAARLLLQRVEDTPASGFRSLLLEAPLCIHGST